MRPIRGEIQWYDDDDNGIKSTAIATDESMGFTHREVVGYNGILKGDYVMYEGNKWRVVMVSRLGDFGLSQTDSLPYTIRVSPARVVKVS